LTACWTGVPVELRRDLRNDAETLSLGICSSPRIDGA
jgi:hypothetical protein